MSKKYTTKDLKKEVDRLNKKLKKESGGSVVRFGFGKRTALGWERPEDTYYITLRDPIKKGRKGSYYGGYTYRGDAFNVLSEKADIGELIKDKSIKTKAFKEGGIRSADDWAWEDRQKRREWDAMSRSSNKYGREKKKTERKEEKAERKRKKSKK